MCQRLLTYVQNWMSYLSYPRLVPFCSPVSQSKALIAVLLFRAEAKESSWICPLPYPLFRLLSSPSPHLLILLPLRRYPSFPGPCGDINDPSESLLCLYLPFILPDAPQVSVSSGPLLPGCTGHTESNGLMLRADSVWLLLTPESYPSSWVVDGRAVAEHKATQRKDPYVVRYGYLTKSWPEGVKQGRMPCPSSLSLSC